MDAEGLPPAVPLDEIAADMRRAVAKEARDLVGRLEAAVELARDLVEASKEWCPPEPVMPDDCDPDVWEAVNGYWKKDKVLANYRRSPEDVAESKAAWPVHYRILPCWSEMSALRALVNNIGRDCEHVFERDATSVLYDCATAVDRREEAVRRRNAAIDAAAAEKKKEEEDGSK